MARAPKQASTGTGERYRPLTADETRARVLRLLRPNSNERVPVCDSREAFRREIVKRRWVVVLDGRDRASVLHAGLRRLVAARGLTPETVLSFYDESAHGELELEAALRFFGDGLAEHRLGLVRPEDFEVGLCALDDAPEAAARLDALGAAEAGAALFPAALRHPATAIVEASTAPAARGRGDAGRRARLLELVAPGELARPKTKGAVRDLMDETGWAVEYRFDARSTLFTWDVVEALRALVSKHGRNAEEVMAFYVDDDHGSQVDNAFLSLCGRAFAAHGLALLRVGGQRLAACAFSDRDEAVALLDQIGLSTGDGPLFPNAPVAKEELLRERPALLPHERVVIDGKSWSAGRSYEDSVFVERNDGSIDLLRIDVWPPTFRGEQFPTDAYEIRAFSKGRRTLVRREGDYPNTTFTGFLRTDPEGPWHQCGKIDHSILEVIGSQAMQGVQEGTLHETRVFRDDQWQTLPIPPTRLGGRYTRLGDRDGIENGDTILAVADDGTLASVDASTLPRIPPLLQKFRPSFVRGPGDMVFLAHVRFEPTAPLFYIVRSQRREWSRVRASSIGVSAAMGGGRTMWPSVMAMFWDATTEQLNLVLEQHAFGRDGPWTCVAIKKESLDAYPREPLPSE